eukprot:6150664-Prymnesium_polylepis.1
MHARQPPPPCVFSRQWMPAKAPLWGNSEPTLPPHRISKSAAMAATVCPRLRSYGLGWFYTGWHPFSSPGTVTTPISPDPVTTPGHPVPGGC